ncbi:MAG: hypothetical protein FIB01_06350 [Gemmatimonadetes bacterium]|nr:hypothetical protein [Gemmatimonadota bacterium]
MRRRLFMVASLLAALPSLAAGQDCEAVRFGRYNVSFAGQPNEVSFFEDAEVSCPGGKRLSASQVISVKAAGRIELIGNVRYQDARRALTAGRAEYYKLQQHIHATGDVVIRDLETGSTVFGQEINYKQAGSARQQDTLEALPATVRPRAVLRDQGPARTAPGDSGAAIHGRPPRGASTTVVADMIQVLGDQHFRGLGSAVITRDSLTAFGGIVDYDQGIGEMQLTVQGRVEGSSYQLLGDTIKARLEQDTLREVTAFQNGKLTTRDVTVEAPRIRIELAQGDVERMTAVRPSSRAAAVALLPPLPRISARDFRLAADSIDVRAPKQQLEEVIAIGAAFSSTNDTVPAPPGVGELEGTLSTDWMRGDTVHAFFSANPRAESDSTANSRLLDRVVSSGAPASSLYRRRETPAAPPAGAAADSARATEAPEYSIGYLLAKRIEITMADGEVRDVNASSDVRGIYLQPRSATATQAARRNERLP